MDGLAEAYAQELEARARQIRAGEDCVWRSALDAAAKNRIELLEGALKTAHEVFAAEIEGLHKIILMNQPDYKRTIVASVPGL